MTNISTLGSYSDVSGSTLMFRNKLINGNFDVWQRGTSQTASGYGSDDRWSNGNLGSTKTTSQQIFSNGQTDVPNSPRYWSRTVVASVANASNYCLKSQSIENVSTLSGQIVTLSFWAKADASKNIAIEFLQYFGTGGTPSSSVSGIGVTTVSLTTSWTKYTVTTSIPSIAGKTLGTANDHFLAVYFWFDAGSSFNSRTNSLGQQSGTFDIAQVQLEAGSSATAFEQRPIGLELSLCQRYFCSFGGNAVYETPVVGNALSSTRAYFCVPFPVEMRTLATLSISSVSHWTACGSGGTGYVATAISQTINNNGPRYGVFYIDVASGLAAGIASLLQANNTLSARLNFSAEL